MELKSLHKRQLEKIDNSDAAEQELAVVSSMSKVERREPPVINFAPAVSNSGVLKGVEKATDRADEVVAEVFGQAVVHAVSTDDAVREELLGTARQVIHEKTQSITDIAETESKAKHFMKHNDACSYFGYEETTTSKFHVRAMAFWAAVLNTIYIFTIGYFIVAPISFILRKLKVVIKTSWVAILLALVIYLIIVAVPILVGWLTDVFGTAEVAQSIEIFKI